MAGKGSRRRPTSPEGQKNWEKFWTQVEKQKQKEQHVTNRQRTKKTNTNGKGAS